MAARLKRFGVVSEQAKKVARLERFVAVVCVLLLTPVHSESLRARTGNCVFQYTLLCSWCAPVFTVLQPACLSGSVG